MRYYIAEDQSATTPAPDTRRCLTLKGMTELTDFSDEEIDAIASMELDQEVVFDFTWVKRVS